MWVCEACGDGVDTLPGDDGLPLCFECDKPVAWRSPIDGALSKPKPARKRRNLEEPPRGIYHGPPGG